MKIKVEDGDISGVTIVLRNLTSGENNEIPGQQRMDLELKLEHNYIISFTKQGYITKKIAFDARMPSERAKQELYPFNFEVILFPQYEGLNVVVFNQPVAKIFFDPLLDDFDYDTDYTKQIQSALKKAEEELVQRQKEEHKLAEEKKKEEQQQLAVEEKKKKEEDRKNREEEKRIKAESDKLIAEQRKIQQVEEEKRRREATASQGTDNRRAVSNIGLDGGPKPPEQGAGNDSRNSIVGISGDAASSSSAEVGGGLSEKNAPAVVAGSDVRSGAVQEEKGADNRVQILDSGNGEDARLVERATETQGVELKNNDVSVKFAEKADPKEQALYPAASPLASVHANIIVEEYQENGRKVTKVSFENDMLGRVFMRVIYDWGGVYYFESGRYISQAYFYSVTNIR